jgi:hypothetical protein
MNLAQGGWGLGVVKFFVNTCANCNNPIPNGKKFCNSSCAAKLNNRLFPKRKKEEHNLCIGCKKPLTRYKGNRKSQTCKQCRESILDISTKAQAQAISRSWGSKNPSESIRQHAKRRAVRYGIDRSRCECCGAVGKTDLCHIRAIQEFPPYAMISEINAKENLAAMCRDCHLLHDRGLLVLIRCKDREEAALAADSAATA